MECLTGTQTVLFFPSVYNTIGTFLFSLSRKERQSLKRKGSKVYIYSIQLTEVFLF